MTKFKIIGRSNGLVYLKKYCGNFTAFSDGAICIGNRGALIELADKDFIAEGQPREFQVAMDKYNADDADKMGATSCIPGQNI